QIETTRVQLETSICEVKSELEAERSRRVEKERSQGGDAASLVSWVESRIERLTDLEAVDLSAQGVGLREKLAFGRKTLGGRDGGVAQDTALAGFRKRARRAGADREHASGVDGGAAGRRAGLGGAHPSARSESGRSRRHDHGSGRNGRPVRDVVRQSHGSEI